MTPPALTKDETQFVPSDVVGTEILTLSDCLQRELLISPDSKRKLMESTTGKTLTDGSNEHPIKDGCPLLYPQEVVAAWQNGALPLSLPDSALKQYVLLSQIKQSGEINAPVDSIPARKHHHRFYDVCRKLTGLVLDVGSDRPSQSAQLLPSGCEYLGLDPYAGHGEFRVIGLGEILPIAASSVDAVLFNTSLDHMLDHHTAIEEAHRVLRVGGQIIIATYAWLERATLLTDSVHFHHFRESEILSALGDRFAIEEIRRYEDPKHATHRYGLYITARRQNP